MKNSLDEIKKTSLPILKHAGVIRASLFGSYVREENQKDSDVDLLVELPKDKSLFDLVDLQNQLQNALGKKIDIITYKSLNPLLKNRILSEQIPIL